jgi:hypothetical protein
MHESITFERVEEGVRESMFGLLNPGFCHACGEDADGVEPDAEKCKCESCGAYEVYGAEQTLIYIA